MKGGAHQSGYTILESMIYLAVTSVLVVAALLLIGGQQSRTEFSQAIRDLDNQIQDVLNDIATGYFPDKAGFSCTANDSGITFSTTPSRGQGTNAGCAFIGKVLQFVEEDGEHKMKIYTSAGRRREDAPWNPNPAVEQEATRLANTKPKLVTPPVSGVSASADLTETYTLKWALEVPKILADKSPPQKVEAVGLYGTFARYDSESPADLVSGALFADVYALRASSPAVGDIADAVEDLGDTSYADTAFDDGAKGIIICVTRGNQRGSIVLGASGGRLSTRVEIGQRRAVCNTP